MILETIRNFLQETEIFGLESIYIATQSIYNSKPTHNHTQLINRIKELITTDHTSIVKPEDIDMIFNYYYNNDNLVHIKEYAKFYNNKILTDYITSMVKIDKTNTILDCNMTINSFIESVSVKYNIDNNKLFGVQSNKIINDIIVKD